jgi:hypothetical protein
LKPGEISKTAEKSGDYASFQAKRSFKGNTLENTGKVLVKRRIIPPEGYPGFRSTLKEAQDFAAKRIVFER